MTDRRTFLAGLLAASLAPQPSWADAGNPAFLSAGKAPDGQYLLCGLGMDGTILFRLHLPARGHAAAAHPKRPEAVAFARRPGTYAIVLDCGQGRQTAQLEAPPGRHFYGHGAFSPDGSLLFTTENDFDQARGMVGVWDANRAYRRVSEFPSGGVGPHDIKLMPDGVTLVVANGGIETHPDTGRAKLNLPTMRSNLSYVDLDGRLMEQMETGPAHQRNSIRHLAVSQEGTVAFAMQWQGDLTHDLPLAGIHHASTGEVKLFDAANIRAMHGYIGSIAIGGEKIAVTSPRSGVVQEMGIEGGSIETRLADVCGVAATKGGFVVTSGTGLIRTPGEEGVRHPMAWDNHLIRL